MPFSVHDLFKLRKEHSLVDVRSQGEYEAGHIRGAINIPILNNEERAAVGTIYKRSGQKEAIKEGFRLVGPRLPEIISETERVADGREILVHCWRGGMRSNNYCAFAKMAGIPSQSMNGGYKAYRHLAVESFRLPLTIILLTGCTGSGKSEVLRTLKSKGEQVLDLEALASHKGSAFGGLFMPPQPTTEQFQNELFEEIKSLDVSRPVWVEDESLAIGKIFLPDDLWFQMRESPLIQIDVSKQVRISRLVQEYGHADRVVFSEIMGRIAKKLGGQNLKAAREKLFQGEMADVMEILLVYYDKAYQESIMKRKEKLVKTIEWDGQKVQQIVDELVSMRESVRSVTWNHSA